MTVVIILLLLFIAILIFLRQPQFGAKPTGARLKRIQQSPNYSNGQFHNKEFTPQLTEGGTVPRILIDFLFRKSKRNSPAKLKTAKTPFESINSNDDVLIWFGHSSYFLQADGKKFLIDPVLSGNASPFSFTTKSFKGSDVYDADELPEIDFLLQTHDHYDHLDYRTITRINNKVKKVITGLGTGSHFEKWNYHPSKISELDWDEELDLGDGFKIHTTTARHFSGRKFNRNNTIWLSFVLLTPSYKIFIGGDSGYGKHFKETGKKFGPFDLAILENGQYNKHWKHIHLMPEEVVAAAEDLNAKVILPVHWAKFSLSMHDWDEPVIRVTREAALRNVAVVHPMIGEALDMKNLVSNRRWWEQIK